MQNSIGPVHDLYIVLQAQWQTLRSSTSMGVNNIFVCVEVLRPSQPNGVMSSAGSLPNHTFIGQA